MFLSIYAILNRMVQKETQMDYRKMIVWQKSMRLIEMTYILLRKLPPEELYALSAQMRRSVISVASNIAEGAGRGTDKDLRHFMTIARGSVTELETQFMVCELLGYLNSDETRPVLQILDEIRRMLSKLILNGKIA